MEDWTLIRQPAKTVSDDRAELADQEFIIAQFTLPAEIEDLARELLEICAPIGSGRYLWGRLSQEQVLEHWRRLNAMATITPLGVRMYRRTGQEKEFANVVRELAKTKINMARRVPKSCGLCLPVLLTEDHLAAARLNRQKRSEYIEQLNRG